MKTVTSQAFNQNPTAIKREANNGPVRITERGKVSHILLSVADYEAITGQTKTIVDLLSMPLANDDIEFEKLNISSINAVDFD